jgi:solute carrier family 32 (vesicular inhibitory amino acid transporter)
MEVGGVNSIENFARSWTRAAGFQEITPRRPSFIIQDHDHHYDGNASDAIEYGRADTEQGRIPRTSLLRAHLQASGGSLENAIDDESLMYDDDETPRPLDNRESENKRLGSDMPSIQGSVRGSVRGRESIFAIAPHLATPLASSYGTSYGTLHSSLTESSMVHAGHLWRQQQAGQDRVAAGEHEPLIVKEVEQDGKVVSLVSLRECSGSSREGSSLEG